MTRIACSGSTGGSFISELSYTARLRKCMSSTRSSGTGVGGIWLSSILVTDHVQFLGRLAGWRHSSGPAAALTQDCCLLIAEWWALNPEGSA
jgi:hypothetical protein